MTRRHLPSGRRPSIRGVRLKVAAVVLLAVPALSDCAFLVDFDELQRGNHTPTNDAGTGGQTGATDGSTASETGASG